MKNKINKSLVALLAMTIILIMFVSCVSMPKVFAKRNNIVNVAVPLSYGFAQYANDRLVGYDIEYLNEIEQMTGLDIVIEHYETTNNNINAMLEKLDNGTVDILSGYSSIPTDENDVAYDFRLIEPNYGFFYGLIVTSRDSSLSKYNFFNQSELKIGYYGKRFLSSLTSELQNLGMTENQQYTISRHTSENDLVDALSNGTIDIALFSSTSNKLVKAQHKVLMRFGSTPFNFMCRNIDNEIYDTFCSAITDIQQSDRLSFDTLEQKYFPTGENDLVFSDEELQYMREHKSLTAIMPSGNPVIARLSKDTEPIIHGVNVQMLGIFQAKTGIQISYRIAQDYQSFLSIIKKGEAAIIGGLSYNYDFAKENNINLTIPYATIAVGMYSKSNINVTSIVDKRIAISQRIALPNLFTNCQVTVYNTPEECFNAVQNGTADIAIDNIYALQYLINNSSGNESYLSTFTDVHLMSCFGLTKPTDPILISLFNKVVRSISTDEINSIIMGNVFDIDKGFSLIEFLNKNAPTLIIIAFALICGLIIIFFWYSQHKQKQIVTAQLLSDIYKRQSELDGLTNIYNAMTLKSRIADIIENGQFECGTMFIVDVDNFKGVNDNYGHLFGDKVLIEIANTFKILAAPTDIYGRYGGDEFIFFREGLSTTKDINMFYKKIISCFGSIDKDVAMIQLSVGACAMSKDNISNIAELLSKSDYALYLAKSRGKNRLNIYSIDDFTKLFITPADTAKPPVPSKTTGKKN